MLNISGDYAIFDNKETITFQNQGESEITIQDVTRRPAVIATDTESGTTFYSSGIEFLIWKETVRVDYLQDGSSNEIDVDEGEYIIVGGNETFVPRINAIITDIYGKKYNVDLIDDGVLRTRWSVKATSQAAQGIN